MRRSPTIPTLCLAVAVAAGACSETTRYRVLSFFFDGVPEPGQPPVSLAPGQAGVGRGGAAVEPTAQARPKVRYYPHTPYRENRCGGCHHPESGELLKPIQQGLCLICHGKLTESAAYVHGPVAVNDCAVCHHHHAAVHPNLLLDDPPAVCLQCHERGDLTEGEHHAELDRRTCTECHDPHGGDHRFFLKRGGT